MITTQPKRWTVKPPVSVPINWGHPLANGLAEAWLLGEGGGPPFDAINGFGAALGTGVSWLGDAMTFPGTAGATTTISYASPGVTFQNGTVFSCAAWIYTAADTTGRNTVFSQSHNNTFGLTLGQHGANSVSANELNVQFPVQTGAAAFVSGRWNLIVFTKNGTTAGVSFVYVNGVSIALTTDVANINFNGNGVAGTHGLGLRIGSGTEYMAAGNRIRSVVLWGRALTQSEAQWLYVEPYAFMQPQTPKNRFWIPAPPLEYGAIATGSIGTAGSGQIGVVG